MSEENHGVLAIGKFRYATGDGHGRMIQQAKDIATKVKGRLHIAATGTSHPLTPEQKRRHAETVFNHPVENTSNVMSALSSLHGRYHTVHIVAGSDRADEYRRLTERYNGKPDKKGNVPFHFPGGIHIHEVSGKRGDVNKHPTEMSQEERERSVSATRVVGHAEKGDYPAFAAYHPGMKGSYVKKMYHQIRKGLGLAKQKLDEEITHKEFGPMLDSFMTFASKHLGIKSMPSLKYKGEDDDFASFGGYNPSEKSITIQTKNRHPMDIYRTIAHELVHHKQNEDGRIKDVAKEGATGSPIEDEANAQAGVVLRHFAKSNPDSFKLSGLTESKAVFVVGVPCSGKDAFVRELKEDNGFQELNIQTLHKTKIISENVVISTVAHDYESVAKAKNLLEHNGFVTEMIFVDVTNEISKLRNEQRQTRGQRVINESVRFKKYSQSQENYSKFETLFEGRITKVMNDDLKEACWKGYTQPKDNPLKPKKGKPGQFVPNCVPKKKGVDESFESFMKMPANREFGTDSLRKIYSEATPGQDGYGKKKIVRKKLNQEQKLDSALTPGGLPPDGIGPEYSLAKSPSLMSGISGVVNESVIAWATSEATLNRFATKYGPLAEQKLIEAATNLDKTAHNTIKMPRSFQTLRESWDAVGGRDSGTVPATSRYKDEELYEDDDKENDPRYMYVKRLDKHYKKPHSDNMVVQDNKLVGKISGPDSNGKWTSYHKKTKEKGSPRVVKGGHKSRQAAIDHILQSVKNNIQEESERDSRLERAGVEGFNKPKRTPGHSKKSHIVVAKQGERVKTIRFGEQGAETAGDPKEGESDRMKKKRASFKARHGRNIAKGKMSAAYWADKVKW